MDRSTRLALVAGATAAAVLATGGAIVAASMAGATTATATTQKQVVAETAILPDPTVSFPALPPLPEMTKQAVRPSDSARPAQGEKKAVTVSRVDALRTAEKAAQGTALDVQEGSREGVPAWVVTVERADGSIVDAYVDKVSGVVFAWQVVREAPQPAPAPQPSEEKYDDDSDKEEGHGKYEDEDERETEDDDRDHDNDGEDDDD